MQRHRAQDICTEIYTAKFQPRIGSSSMMSGSNAAAGSGVYQPSKRAQLGSIIFTAVYGPKSVPLVSATCPLKNLAVCKILHGNSGEIPLSE
jgi:hypothetical protein